MNDTVKVVIEIPKRDYEEIKKVGVFTFPHLSKAIREATPLDEDKGEWIEVVTERFPNGEKRMWHYECSACSTGEPPCPINKEHWDFCPNCGADMRPEPYKAESEDK